jgi:DNA-binding LacI/PurR family transcriptional regulator
VAVRSRAPKTTIVDIARASGVSVTTVSRILNDKPDVAQETRDRVMRVMDDLGFAPQNAWRQIRSGRTRLIAMHVPQEFNPPAYRLIMAAALDVEDAGYSINIMTRSITDAELLAIFRGRQADGIILLEILVEDRRPILLRDHGFPFVMIGRRADNAGLSFVDVDIEHGVDIAVEHLVGIGHERIGFVTVDPTVGDKRYGFGTWALDAYELACARRGLHARVSMGEPTIESMASAAARLFDEGSQVTAVIAPQEHSVIGVLRAAQARSMTVPRDLSIVAMLSDAMADLSTPSLTTIDFPADQLGGTAARMLLSQLDGAWSTPEQVLVKPELIIRDSTAVPRP